MNISSSKRRNKSMNEKDYDLYDLNYAHVMLLYNFATLNTSNILDLYFVCVLFVLVVTREINDCILSVFLMCAL